MLYRFQRAEAVSAHGVHGWLTDEELQAQNAALAQVTQAYRHSLSEFSDWPAVSFNRN
ncbi:hypothetical protein ACQKDS_03475 [Serratia sp. NPDC078593]|uniref:hypothetical protein n=1 Tax=unclassified Serratia (in: enterobacteria) TaxID=2647522 RepID=UPI0037D37146